jgi:hypothetical protein
VEKVGEKSVFVCAHRTQTQLFKQALTKSR